MRASVKRRTAAGVLGALYAVLTLLLSPISYGAVQFRLSEALCVFAFFDPLYAAGLFAGCLIANLIGSGLILDIIFGSLATLGAGLCMAALGRHGRGWGRCIAACAMPVVFNAVVIGAVLAASLVTREAFWASFALFGAQVGVGELVVMALLGLPLLRFVMKRPVFQPYID